MLIGADLFLQSLHSFRTCRFDGRYGGGKTLISVVLSEWLHKTYGYHIYSNVPIFLDGVVDSLPACSCDKCLGTYKKMLEMGAKLFPQNHSVILYDEAWLSFRIGCSPKMMNEYLAYIRKLDLIMLMPSVLKLHRDASQLYCKRWFNFGIVGLPLWVYEWGVTGKSVKESGGKFALWRPSKYFGTYDTFAQPDIMDGLFSDAGKSVDLSAKVLSILEQNDIDVGDYALV